jgi:hypothetical protein
VDHNNQTLHAEPVPQVDIPGALGNSAILILESLPNLSLLNGLNPSSIIENGKHIVDSALQPRLPECSPEEPLAERVIGAMWLYLMTYRLSDEEKIDETPVWYAIFHNLLISSPSRSITNLVKVRFLQKIGQKKILLA